MTPGNQRETQPRFNGHSEHRRVCLCYVRHGPCSGGNCIRGGILSLVLARHRKPSHLILLTAAFWFAFNVPVYRSLKRKAELWGGERRATRQVAYIEICSTLMLLGLSLLARDISGGRELILFLRYLFSSWILCLLGYQAFLHLVLGYRISTRDAVRWCLVGAIAIYSFYA